LFLDVVCSNFIKHVKHCYRFHRYVGSPDEKSGVLFHDDENDNIFFAFKEYLHDRFIDNNDAVCVE